MSKKTIIAGVMSVMMLSSVPVFAATPNHHENTPAHHISTEVQHIDHNKNEVKPPKHKEAKAPKHKEVKPAPHHDNHNTIDDTTKGRG